MVAFLHVVAITWNEKLKMHYVSNHWWQKFSDEKGSSFYMLHVCVLETAFFNVQPIREIEIENKKLGD